MAANMISKYVWLLETLRRHKHLRRDEINRLWVLNESLSQGRPLSRRTLYTYMRAIEQTFDINIEYNASNYEYYLDDSLCNSSLHDWLIDSISINDTMSATRDISDRIMFGTVSSAKDKIPLFVEAIRSNTRVRFKHTAFARHVTTNADLEPFYLRLFESRWYVIGYDHVREKVTTFALDRISDIVQTTVTFTPPEKSAEEFFADGFGIYLDQSQVKDVVLKVSSWRAGYLRELPLHRSQSEKIGDEYSIFRLKIQITPDFEEKLMSFGADVEVLEPKLLRIRMKQRLEKTLEPYLKDN